MSDDERPTGPLPDNEMPDRDRTMQRDNPVPGRQRYRSARPPGDYTQDFGADGTIAHPVKGVDETPSDSVENSADDPAGGRKRDAAR